MSFNKKQVANAIKTIEQEVENLKQHLLNGEDFESTEAITSEEDVLGFITGAAREGFEAACTQWGVDYKEHINLYNSLPTRLLVASKDSTEAEKAVVTSTFEHMKESIPHFQDRLVAGMLNGFAVPAVGPDGEFMNYLAVRFPLNMEDYDSYTVASATQRLYRYGAGKATEAILSARGNRPSF